MSDFHRSLDRALDGHSHDWTPPVVRSFVDNYDPHTDWGVSGEQIRAIQDKIGADIKALAQITLSPAVVKPAGRYDIRYRDPEIVRPLSDMEALMAEFERPMIKAAREHERYYLSVWTRLLVDVAPDLRDALCDHEIPAEGVE